MINKEFMDFYRVPLQNKNIVVYQRKYTYIKKNVPFIQVL